MKRGLVSILCAFAFLAATSLGMRSAWGLPSPEETEARRARIIERYTQRYGQAPVQQEVFIIENGPPEQEERRMEHAREQRVASEKQHKKKR